MPKFKKNDVAIANEFNFAWDKGQEFLVNDVKITACCGIELIQIKSNKLANHDTVCACKEPSGTNWFSSQFFTLK